MERHSEAHPSTPHSGITEPTPFGTLSKLPLEVRLQIYSLLLPSKESSGALSKSITPCHKLESSYRKVVDITIMEVSGAISAEVIELFYSTNTFLFEIPVCFLVFDQPTFRCDADRQGNELPITQTFTYPSQHAWDHIKSLEIEFYSPSGLEHEEYDMGNDSASLEMLSRLRTPRVLRNELTVHISRSREASPLWLKTLLFQTLPKLPAFEVIKMKVEEGRRQRSYDVEPKYNTDIRWGEDVLYYRYRNMKYVIEIERVSAAVGAVEEEYRSTWGPATIHWECGGALIVFKPRAHLNKLR